MSLIDNPIRAVNKQVELGHCVEARHFGVDALGELHASFNRSSK
jgi:hypothetical protein